MNLSDEKGITLIEIVFVLLIFSIISLLILPKIHLVERYQLKSQAQTLAADLRNAQKLAISKNSSYYFTMMINDNGYNIRKDSMSLGIEKRVYLPKNIKFGEGSKDTIKYTPKGTLGGANGPPAGTIILTSKNYEVKITVIPATGKVKVYDLILSEKSSI